MTEGDDQIRALVTGGGAQIPILPRTAAIIEELLARQDHIEGMTKGAVEISVDCAGRSLTVAIREVGAPRRLPSAR